jgi:type IV secretory pathway TraG/TraD family ATPase VirD4
MVSSLAYDFFRIPRLPRCATKAIFNPLEPESAKIFSDYLGDEHLKYGSPKKERTHTELKNRCNDE